MSFTQSYTSFTYRLADGSIPRYQGLVGIDALWISVGNLSILDVPWTILSEGRPYDDPEFGLTKLYQDEATDPIALINQPAFLCTSSWWRAYQPTYPTTGYRWFQVSCRKHIYPYRDLEEDEHFSFSSQLKNDIIKDCSALRDDLTALRKLKAFPVSAPLPPFPSFEPLDQSFTYRSFAIEFCRYLYYFRAGMGIFNWWRVRTVLYNPREYWWYFLPDTTVQRVRTWNLEDLAARGVLLNLTIDRHRIDLNLLVHSEIGFAYPWTVSTERDPRFLRWSPSYLARVTRFVRESQEKGRFMLEDEMARSIGSDVRTVTAYDTTLSEIQVVPESAEIPFGIVKREKGVTNAYFALVSGWDPLPVETNLEWNELAKYFQVVKASRTDVDGPVFVAQAQRPFGNLLLPSGIARSEFNKIFSPLEFLSAYWNPTLYIQWFDSGLYRSNLSVQAPNIHLESSLADCPYYPPTELDELLFNNLLPSTHRWRMDSLRERQILKLKEKSGHSSQFMSQAFDATSSSSVTLSHVSSTEDSLDKTIIECEPETVEQSQDGGKMMIVRTKGGVEGKEVKDTVANRLIWGTIGSIVRAKRPSSDPGSNKALAEPKSTRIPVPLEGLSTGTNDVQKASPSPAKKAPVKRYRVGDKKITDEFVTFSKEYYPSMHKWKLDDQSNVTVAPTLIATLCYTHN